MIADRDVIQLADGSGYAVYDGSQVGTLIVQKGDNLPEPGMWLRDAYDAATAAAPAKNGDGG